MRYGWQASLRTASAGRTSHKRGLPSFGGLRPGEGQPKRVRLPQRLLSREPIHTITFLPTGENMKSAIAALLVLAFAASCARVGRRFDPALVDQIQPGTTTKAEIEAWFGRPYSVSTVSSAQSTAVQSYTYVHAVAGAFRRTRSSALVVTFDASDIVVDKSYTQQ